MKCLKFTWFFQKAKDRECNVDFNSIMPLNRLNRKEFMFFLPQFRGDNGPNDCYIERFLDDWDKFADTGLSVLDREAIYSGYRLYYVRSTRFIYLHVVLATNGILYVVHMTSKPCCYAIKLSNIDQSMIKTKWSMENKIFTNYKR